jgi:hypothetical protein
MTATIEAAIILRQKLDRVVSSAMFEADVEAERSSMGPAERVAHKAVYAAQLSAWREQAFRAIWNDMTQEDSSPVIGGATPATAQEVERLLDAIDTLLRQMSDVRERLLGCEERLSVLEELQFQLGNRSSSQPN